MRERGQDLIVVEGLGGEGFVPRGAKPSHQRFLKDFHMDLFKDGAGAWLGLGWAGPFSNKE